MSQKTMASETRVFYYTWWTPHTRIYEVHYDDVIMTTIASQITSLMSVYSTVYSDADQRKHQSSASLAFVWGIHRDRWIPRTQGQLRGKCFHLMTSSWWRRKFGDKDSFAVRFVSRNELLPSCINDISKRTLKTDSKGNCCISIPVSSLFLGVLMTINQLCFR